MTPPFLQARSLHFAYGKRPALRGVDLDLAPGELVALLGPNGSGKSTLIKSLLGTLPAQGEILWESRPLKKWNRRALARRLAYLPQSPVAAPNQTVADVLRLGRAPYWGAFGLESPRDLQVVGEVAELLGLTEMLDRPVDELSGGQRQSVFVGRCLVQEPVALLLDEPNTFLDLRHQLDLLQLLKKLTRERGVAVLMASHDLNLSAAFADRLLLMQEGTLAASGPPDAVLEEEILSRIYGIEMTTLTDPSGRRIVLPRVP